MASPKKKTSYTKNVYKQLKLMKKSRILKLVPTRIKLKY